MYAYYKMDQHSEADTGTVLRLVERQGRPTGNSNKKKIQRPMYTAMYVGSLFHFSFNSKPANCFHFKYTAYVLST